MKPFNLEEAKAGKPVCTRDGKPVRIVCWDRKWSHVNSRGIGNFTILALVIYEDGEEGAVGYSIDGRRCPFDSNIRADDLMMATVTKTMWMNIYEPGFTKGWTTRTLFGSEQEAIRNAKNSGEGHMKAYITTIPITWEE